MAALEARRIRRRRATQQQVRLLEDLGYTIVRIARDRWVLLGPGGQPLRVNGRKVSKSQYEAILEAVRRMESEGFV